MLAALGATADVPLDVGGLALRPITKFDIAAALEVVADVELIAATDVDNPLLGLTGAARPVAASRRDRIVYNWQPPPKSNLVDAELLRIADVAEPPSAAASKAVGRMVMIFLASDDWTVSSALPA